MGQGHLSGAPLDFRAWPGLGKGTGARGPFVGIPFSLKLCPFLSREEEKGLLRPFLLPSHWSLQVIR